MTKGCVYYTDGRLDPVIRDGVRRTIEASGLPIVCVSLVPESWTAARRIDAFDCWRPRGPLTMFYQILAGLETLAADVAFLTEHDVLYSPEHFAFEPPRDDVYYYNQHVWKVRASDGHCLHYPVNQTSGLCANRELLVRHYRERIRRVELEGYTTRMGYEPGTHNRAERVDDYGCESWMAAVPNVDIRHGANLTRSRWTKDAFRNQRYTEGWTEGSAVPGWPGTTLGRFDDWLREAVAPREVSV